MHVVPPALKPVATRRNGHNRAIVRYAIHLVYSRQMASGLLVDEAEDEGKITIGGEFGHAEGTGQGRPPRL